MMTIQRKIVYLSLFVLFIMILTWSFMNYNNQKTMSQYMHILQRYLLLNQISNLSERMNSAVNQYRIDENEDHLQQYMEDKQQLLLLQDSLSTLSNPHNRTELTNYNHLIDGFVDSLDLAVESIAENRHELAEWTMDEAVNIAGYISETTLSLISIDLNTYDEFLRYMIDRSESFRNMELWMLAFASCLMILLSIHLSESITRPIRRLSQAAKEFSYGKLDRDIPIDSQDEIGFLSKTFNRMRKELQNLIVEIRHKAKVEQDLQNYKLMLKESELKSLQSQINPHFLFNTLNTLAKKAYLEGAAETSDLISSVSSMMRYHLRKLDTQVTLEDELDGLEHYLLIQKARFGERVRYQVDVDPTALKFHMPNLTLQPFVENVFLHAIEPAEDGGEIRVIARDEDERIHIRIEDDGPGIPPANIRSILQGKGTGRSRHASGIGIANVINRLRLYYETPDIIEIDSGNRIGTTVHLYLPKKMEGQA